MGPRDRPVYQERGVDFANVTQSSKPRAAGRMLRAAIHLKPDSPADTETPTASAGAAVRHVAEAQVDLGIETGGRPRPLERPEGRRGA